MSKLINGNAFFRALAYSAAACPKDDKGIRLQHVVFVGDRIVCADGERWHVGWLPAGTGPSKPLAATRSSVQDLLLGLEYTRRMSKRSGYFEVRMEGRRVVIKYGERELEHVLDEVDVGEIPATWAPPVPDDAPPLQGEVAEFRCGHVQAAMQWYRSWERDYGTTRVFGLGGANPARYDVVSNGDLVVQAYLLPVEHTPAQLPDDAPLLDKAKGQQRRQSILDLSLAAAPPAPPAEGAPAAKKPRKAKGKKDAAAPAAAE